jgi:carboxyl-terminal processing protease
MSWKKAIIFVFIFFTFLGFSFYGGFYFGKTQCKVCPPQEIDFSLFWEVYNKLKENFVDKEKIDDQKILEGAISGMVKSLGDPYTVFLNKEKTKRFIEDTKGSFEGIGAEIGIKKGQLQIVAPLEGTPAQKAGLRAGDKILKIDGKPTIDMSLEEAVSLIRGPKGTKVVLTIYRDEWEEPKDIEIERDKITIPSIKLEFKEVDGEKIAYLKIYQFTENASSEFEKTAKQILSEKTRKIVLDLRDNPGGYLDVAEDIAGWFLKKGTPILIEDFGRKDQKIRYSKGNGLLSSYSLVVLVNQGTASGAEILAGALRDNKNVLLIGEKTFGKGSVQTLEKLSNNSSLKITIAKWLTPKGEMINEKGLEPDIKIKMSEEDYKQGKDPQLEKALEILKNL